MTARQIPPGMDQPDSYDYEGLWRIAHRLRCPISALYALSSSNDPFYITPARQADAEWFAKLWKKFGVDRGVHIRRIHYWLVSVSHINMPDGTPYENSKRCEAKVNSASKDARYLDLVPVEAFIDRRNAAPITNFRTTGEPELNIEPGDMAFPNEMPDPPILVLRVPEPTQRYQIEIWAEKTTMNDILAPIAEQYGCTLQTGMGELSVTHCNSLVQRAKADGRPVRILYISDFDPAGQSMPPAVARKVEFFLFKGGYDFDIQLRSVVLTKEQCEEYDLPRTPIKESEDRGKAFEERHGEGATELDALEAIHPGKLAEILEEEIMRYYDDGLKELTEEETNNFEIDEVDQINEQIHKQHAKDIKRLREEYAALVAAHTRWFEQAKPVWRAITVDLEAAKPELPNWPSPVEGDEDDDPLYDSTRDYFEQLEYYKAFQGKPNLAESSKPDPVGTPSRTRPSHGGGRPVTIRGNPKLAGKVAKVAGVGDKEASVVAMLKRKWCAASDVSELTGWTGFSLPRIARKTGLTLQIRRMNGKNQYRI
jgi:hypothetical protein